MVGYSFRKGGIETFIDNLLQDINSEEFEIILSLPEMVIDGKKWCRPENRHNYLKWHLFWSTFFAENKFDAIYYNTCDVVSIDMLRFAKKANVPIRIIHSHNTGNMRLIESKQRLFHAISEKINKSVLGNYATHLLACSQEAGYYLFGRDKNFDVVKNGVSLSKYSFSESNRKRIRDTHNFYENDYVIGCISSLSPQKNVFFSLDVFSQIAQTRNDIHLVFLGDGEKYHELQEEIKRRHLSDRVILKGAVNNINEWVSALDCVLMPSFFEGLPFALVEAQAAGLPCVVSTGVPEEANLTGLLQFISLAESKESWADTVISACKKPRIDTTNMLVEAGYSMETTVRHIERILLRAKLN